MRFPLGVVSVVYRPDGDVAASARAAEDGFAHVDPSIDSDPAVLALPVGCPLAFPRPRPGWCATPSPPAGDGMWERAVRWWRRAPGALLEPWVGAAVGTTDAVRAFVDEVPGLRLLLDTGHVAAWGGDPLELCDLAAHVQLRQGAPGRTQLHVDDPDGVVDFPALLDRLEAVAFQGMLSVEHFDLPEMGWPCADPRGWSLDLAGHVGARR